MTSWQRSALWLLGLALCSGCVSKPVLQPALPTEQAVSIKELSHTPFFPQQQYHCGPAALAAMLNFSGVQVTPEALADRVYLPKKRGSLQVELLAAARSYQRLPYRINPNLPSLLAEVGGGNPVLVLLNLGWRSRPVWHYAVVVGYDTINDRVILRSGAERRKVVAADDFVRAWVKADNWGLVVLQPGQLPSVADEIRYLEIAAAMESSGATDAALRSFRAASAQWPESALARFGTGNALYAQGHLRQAASAYRQAVRLDPGMIAARNNLTHVLTELGCSYAARQEMDAIDAWHNELPAELTRPLAQTRQMLAQLEAESAAQWSRCRIDGTRALLGND